MTCSGPPLCTVTANPLAGKALSNEIESARQDTVARPPGLGNVRGAELGGDVGQVPSDPPPSPPGGTGTGSCDGADLGAVVVVLPRAGFEAMDVGVVLGTIRAAPDVGVGTAPGAPADGIAAGGAASRRPVGIT